jgi:hypothetical protein
MIVSMVIEEFSIEQQNAIVRKYRDGATLSELCEELDLTLAVLTKACPRLTGAKVRRKGYKGFTGVAEELPSLEFTIKNLVSVYLSGKSLRKTGRVFGISGEMVRLILKKEGVPTRKLRRLDG